MPPLENAFQIWPTNLLRGDEYLTHLEAWLYPPSFPAYFPSGKPLRWTHAKDPSFARGDRPNGPTLEPARPT